MVAQAGLCQVKNQEELTIWLGAAGRVLYPDLERLGDPLLAGRVGGELRLARVGEQERLGDERLRGNEACRDGYLIRLFSRTATFLAAFASTFRIARMTTNCLSCQIAM